MTDNIDEKVVSMRFDNAEFEKGVSESLKTIQELKKSLDFDAAVKNLEGLQKAGRKFDFSGVSDAIDTVKDKFSALEIAGITALANLTNSAVNAGKRMVSSLTIDPVKTGMNIYEQKLSSVQTIINNSGKSLSEVNDILNKLNKYSDKTVFSLNDMTNALSKFTAQGVDAGKAVDIIIGAANEAASMGAGSSEFSRMIYNLTQAYGMGSMKILDWKSFESANVAGREFKEQIIESAIRLGTLDKEGRTLDKHIKVTTKNFREMLNTGFMSAEVMSDTFEKYAGLNKDFQALADKALGAAQNVKTFTQLLDVLKESVASQWSQSWSYIIGDFNEARTLWTAVSTLFDSTIGKINQARTDLLKAWHDGFADPKTGEVIGGRRMLIDSLCNILVALKRALTPIKEAFRDLFPAKTAENLWEATKAFKEFTAKLRLSEGAMKQIHDFAHGIFSVMKFVRDLFKDLLAAVFPATEGVNSLLGVVLGLAGAFGRALTNLVQTIKASEEYQEILNAVGQTAVAIIKIITVLVKMFYKLAKTAKDTGVLQAALSGIAKALGFIVGLVTTYGPKIVTIVGAIAKIVGGLVSLLVGGVASIGGFFVDLFSKKDGKDAAEGINEVTRSITDLTKTDVSEAGENVTKGFGAGLLAGVGALLKTVVSVFKSIIGTTEETLDEHSPSKIFIAIGAFCLAGFLIGITDPTIKAKITNAIETFANTGVIQGFKDVLGKGFKGIATVWNGLVTIVVNLVKTISAHLQGLGGESEGIAAKIGRVFNSLFSGIQQLNGAAILLTAVVGGALVGVIKLLSTVVNVTHFFDEVGGGFFNITASFRTTAKAFNNMAKAFKRQQSPIVSTLRGIALSILAITTSLLILSTIEDKGSLWTAFGNLIATLALVTAIIVGAAAIIKGGNLSDQVDTISKMVLITAGSIMLLTVALSTMASLLSDVKTSGMIIIESFVVLGMMCAGMYFFIKKLADLDLTGSIKSVILMLSFTGVLNACVRALKKLSDAKNFDNIADAAWCLLGVVGALAGLSYATRFVSMPGVLTFLGICLLMRSIVYAIENVEWSAVMNKIMEYQNVLIALISAAGIMSYLASMLGKGMKDFGVGILSLTSGVLALAISIAVLKNFGNSWEAIGQAAALLLEVAGLAALMMAVCKYADVPQKDMKQLSKLIFSMGLILIELAAACAIMEASGADVGMAATLGLTLAAFTVALGFLVKQFGKTKKADVRGIAKVIRSFTLPILAIALLARTLEGSSFGDVAALVTTLAVVFGGLALVLTTGFASKPDDVKMMGKMIGLLLTIAGSLVLLSMIPYEKILPAMAAMTVSLLSIYLVTKGMSGVKPDAAKPMLAAVLAMIAIGASLAVLSKLCDWQSVLASAGAMSAVMIALSVSLAIVNKTSHDAIAGALALAIAAGSLFIVGFTLMQFADSLKTDTVLPACLIMLGIAGSLALVGKMGGQMILGATSMVIAAVALIGVAYSLQMFAQVCNMPGLMDTFITVSIVILGLTVTLGALAESGIALLGAAALVIVAGALIAVAYAMQMFADANVSTDYLKDLAGALALIGAAGLVLTAGGAGLIIGGIGLIAIAAALRIMSGIDTKVINGTTLAGIADGLSLLGGAGIILGLGAAGLIIGGIGLMSLSLGLRTMQGLDYDALSKNNLSGLATGLVKLAAVGLAGTVAGPGLIVMSVGLLAIAGAITVVVGALSLLQAAMEKFSADDAEKMGENTIAGYQNGIAKTAPTMLSVVGSVFTGLLTNVRNILGIHSPSEVMHKIAEFTGLGFIHGWAESPIVQKWDQISEANAKNHVLAPFTDALKDGFGEIGGLFSGLMGNSEVDAQIEKEEKHLEELQKKLKELQAKNADQRAITGTMRQIGDVETRIYKLRENLSTESLFGGFDSLFEGILNGLPEFKTEFVEVGDILDSLDFSTEGLSIDLDDLAVSLDSVSEASGQTTKTFAENMDIFDAFDRSLKTTVSDIEKNMIDQLLGTNQWNQYLENLINLGFDPRLVKEIKDKGMSAGFQIAATLNSVGTDYDEVLRFNEYYEKKFALGSKNDAVSLWLDELVKNGVKSTRNMDKYVTTQDQRMGDYAKVTEGRVDEAAMFANESKEMYEHAVDQADYEARRNELLTDEEKEAARKEHEDAANAKAQKTTADEMMSEMSDAIKKAIKKYLPASEFIEIGENICLGLTAGVIRGESMTVAEIETLCTLLKQQAMKTLNEHSPSKVFQQIGEYCTEGLAIGLRDTNGTEKSAKDLTSSLIDIVYDQMAKIQAIMESDDLWQPTIKPVVDFSNITASAEQAKLLFDGTQIQAAARDVSNYQVTTQPSSNTLAGMTRNEFGQFLQDFADVVVNGINSGDKDVNVNVNLVGNSKGLFKVVRDENEEYKHATGYSAFV